MRIAEHESRLVLAAVSAGAAVLVALIAPALGHERTTVILLSSVNLAVVALAMRALMRAGAIRWAPVLAFLPGVGALWPIATLYFSFFSPDASCFMNGAGLPCLEKAEWLQLSILAFLAAYLFPVALASAIDAGRRPVVPALSRLSRFEEGLAVTGVVAVTLGWIAALPGIPPAVAFPMHAARNYFSALLFVPGYRWKVLPARMRVAVLASCGVTAVVQTIANARTYALWPILLLGAGYALSPDVTGRAVRRVALVVALVLPIYLLIGDQTRIALGTVGLKDVDERTAVLQDALSGTLQQSDRSAVENAMVRLFSPGGQILVAENLVHRPADRFHVAAFGRELLRSLRPSFLGGQRGGQYSGSGVLAGYGFLITDETSSDVSLIGNLVYMGGLLGVVLGALTLGVVHVLLARHIAARATEGGAMLASTGGLLSASAWAYNFDLISHLRDLVWTQLYVGAACGIVALYLLVKASGRRHPAPHPGAPAARGARA